MNERDTLPYKNIPLLLYSRKGWCWLCVRGELEMGTDCNILTQSSSYHSSTSFSSWLGSLRAQSALSAAGSHFGILSPTDSNCNWNWLKRSVAIGYIIASRYPASAVRPLIYTGESLDWWLGRGSLYNICRRLFLVSNEEIFWGFIADQPLLVIWYQILFIHMHLIYMISKHILLIIFSTQLIGFKFCYVAVITQHPTFVCTHLNKYT